MQPCIARAMVAEYLAGIIRVAGAAGRQRDRFSLNLAPYPTIRPIAIHRGNLEAVAAAHRDRQLDARTG